MSVDDLNESIEKVQNEYNADVYFYSGSIDEEGFHKVARCISKSIGARSTGLLILATNGGQANSAYQIGRLFQRRYENFIVCCPGRCKSAGTLVAVGATKLIMGMFSELGPLDVQLLKQDEIANRKSGLLAKSSFDALADAAFELYERLMLRITVSSGGQVSFKVASELSASMTAGMLSPVYSQINPDIVGAEHRDLSVAKEYGDRLSGHAGNAVAGAIDRLVSAYPSHDFIIDRTEAEDLFVKVEEPSDALENLIKYLGRGAFEEQDEKGISIIEVVATEVDSSLNDSLVDGELESDLSNAVKNETVSDINSALDTSNLRSRRYKTVSKAQYSPTAPPP